MANPPADAPRAPTLADAYSQLDELGVEVSAYRFKNQVALASSEGLLAVDYTKLATTAEELEVLLHEIGHFSTGAFYAPDAGPIQRARAEVRASRYVFETCYPPALLARLMLAGEGEPWLMAERLGLPERFVREMLLFYTELRGVDFASLCETLRQHDAAATGQPAAKEESETSESNKTSPPAAEEPPGENSTAGAAPPLLLHHCLTEDGRPLTLLLEPDCSAKALQTAIETLSRFLSTEDTEDT